MTTLAEYLINENIPKELHFKGVLTKKAITAHLTKIAKERPDVFPDIVHNVKSAGNLFATYEGLSVGLDDITPDYKVRDKIFTDTEKKFKVAKTEEDKTRILLEAQSRGLELTSKHRGELAMHVASGARGKSGQLLKTIVSPVVAKGANDVPQNFLIRRSYAEGLSTGEYWLTAGESRRELGQVQLGTALPGETSKVLTNVLNNVLITKTDCGTKNGLEYDLDDHHILDRYEANTNHLIDNSYVRSLKSKKKKTLLVRSPMTCLEHPGVCQKCYGLNSNGQHYNIGTNIGLRSAQYMAEPLTQMTLSAKHGGMMAREAKPELSGMKGFRQLLAVPEIFKDEAVLAQSAGKVTHITESPQGGYTVGIGDTEHYVSPKRKLLVTKGQDVLPGHMLSDGVPNPKQVVSYQGLGIGRKYVADTIHDIYKRSGVDMDKRHVELLTKQTLNHALVTESDMIGRFVKGDIVPYNTVKEHFMAESKAAPLSTNLVGKTLGGEYLHFTAGTPITHDVLNTLKSKNINKVLVSTNSLKIEPIMKPIEQVPLLQEDWISRLAHRKIKETLTKGTAEAWSSDVHGASPYAPLIYKPHEFAKDISKGVY